jgi:hypothetical protein
MPASKSTPVKAEALNDTIRFSYDGEQYEIPSAADWDVDALEAFEDQKIITCVRLILGPEQWKRFKAKKRTMGDLNGLFTEMQAHLVGPSGN